MNSEEKGRSAQSDRKIDVSVKIYPAHDSGNLLANASVTIGGCFAIRGVRVLNSEKGAFVSMPQRKTFEGEYKDICFPTTAQMRRELNSTVLGEYRKTIEQEHSKPEKAAEPRGSVVDDVKQKAVEVRPPEPGKAKPADKGAR